MPMLSRHFGAWAIAPIGALLFVLVGTEVAAQVNTPAPVTILKNSGQTADGYIFYTQQNGAAPGNGPVVMDTQGRPIWFAPLATAAAADLRVQTYQGQPVLTWGEGAFQNATSNNGVGHIYDSSYNEIATVRAGNGMGLDLHEFELTSDGTALITIYHLVPKDLTPWGGVANGSVTEGVVQEIDIATGAVRFEWHSLDHIGLDESYMGPPASASFSFDYFHINSVKVDFDGNLLVSARHTSALYKINRTTGAVIWRLGGKKSDFTLGPGLSFALQHNATPVDPDTIRIFDNGSSAPSHVLWIQYETASKFAVLQKAVQHPQGLFASAEGSAQSLPNGDTFVGWGTAGAFSEFDSQGNLIYDVRLPRPYTTYRAFRQPWVGRPAVAPTVAAYVNDDGSTTVHAVWNGATEVGSWEFLGATGPDSLHSLAVVPWNGLDTTYTVSDPINTVQVVALDRSGATMATSSTLSGPFNIGTPAIIEQPDPVTIATGSTLVLSVAATNGAAYAWRCNNNAISDGTVGAAVVSGSATPQLMIRGATLSNAGRYVCVVSNATGAATSSAAAVTVANTSDIGRLINLSCRAYVSGDEDALIAGFVVGDGTQSGTDDLAIRASGPALIPYGVTDVLPDPQINLFNGAGKPLATVSSRTSVGVGVAMQTLVRPRAEVESATGLDPRDAMLTQTLSPANYTAIVSSPTGADGVALLELDDTRTGSYSPTVPRLINASGRAHVGTGSDVLVAGFVITGSTARTVLIRASGPAIANWGVTDALPDPRLDLYSSSGAVIATNDNWEGNAQIATVAGLVGAFPWSSPTSKDAALLITLAPGAYTAQVSGADGRTGVALVEVYDAQ